MSKNSLERRDFLKFLLGGTAMIALDWNSFPKGLYGNTKSDEFDAIIIGTGLGGLSCAAAFVRQGFRPLLLEQHDRVGGYATTFKRPGGFVFDVSLHSTAVSERDGIHNIIQGFPEITDVEFLPHPNLYRIIYPDHDIRVPQKNLEEYKTILTGYFPEEKVGITEIYNDMQGLVEDIGKISNVKKKLDMSKFPIDFPYLFKSYTKTWGDFVDERISNPKLKAIISSQWPYYGLPPSKLSSFYYALPAIDYLKKGGYYPNGKSQKISNALAQYIEKHGGKIMLKERVEKILVKNKTAYGVKTEKGEELKARVVVSNANAFDTFGKMLNEEELLKEYKSNFDNLSVSLSSFQIFLGLKNDLVGKSGIIDSEIFYESSYDMDESYNKYKNADVETGSFSVTLYDNIYKGYSPQGKNTINIFVLQGYDHWKKYEIDYFQNNKAEYRKEKKRMADVLIKRVEKIILPGLSDVIEVKEIATPITNKRYTSNYNGAIYGWNQTLNNSGNNRISHDTPIKNLYLSGAWSKPGHGYGGVLHSGLGCFRKIMKNWES